MPLVLFEIVDLGISSESTDNHKHLHPCMECDHPNLPIRVVDSLSSHYFLDYELH
jgi:hypothetical protein